MWIMGPCKRMTTTITIVHIHRSVIDRGVGLMATFFFLIMRWKSYGLCSSRLHDRWQGKVFAVLADMEVG